MNAVKVLEFGPGQTWYRPGYGYCFTAASMRPMSASTPGPRTSANNSGFAPYQRLSGARWLEITTVPALRRRQPMTSFPVKVLAPVGLTAIHVCTPNHPRQLTARAEYTCTTASGVDA